MLDEEIFKSYDIRGIYPKTINEELTKKIGLAFVNLFNLKRVGVGRDGRISSKPLEKALIQSIKEAGADTVQFDIISTDMIYFASAYYKDLDGAVIVTASHNPKDNNGFKFILKNAIAVSGEEGLYKMRDLIKKDKLKVADKEGKEFSREIYNDYVRKLLSLIDVEKIKPLKVVVDAGNGVGGFIFEKVIKGLPIKMIPLYCDIDGNFPNHQPSPIEEKNLIDLKKKVTVEKADLGIAFDGDGDRIFLVDEKGQSISATITGAMIIKKMLKKKPGAKILYNLICGWIVPEIIKANGGTSSITKVGHSLIKEQMRKEDGLFTCEHSGHYYFRDLYYADSGMLASLVILNLLSEENRPISKIAAEYNKYYLSGEINYEVDNQKQKIAEIKKIYNDGRQSELDGLSVEYRNWRFNIRPSNTEPLLRLNIEAKSKKLMEEKIKEISKLIKSDK